MTPDPDAPASLRNVAEMMRDVMRRQSRAAQKFYRNAADSLSSIADEFDDIVTAPAVAKAGDVTITNTPRPGDLPGSRDRTPPPDPFAPMVDAFNVEWLNTGNLRRALAAAIENAPMTDAMATAWTTSRSSGVNAAWRVFNSTLAAELRGGK